LKVTHYLIASFWIQNPNFGSEADCDMMHPQ
jgi:hypothetical protein